MRRVLPIALMILVLAPSRAQALTSRDVIELSRAGLGEEVLLALIEADGGVFTLDTATLTALKQAGVSERVILAMVRSGRTSPPEAIAAEPAPIGDQLQQPQAVAPPPQVIVIEHQQPVAQPVAVPVYVPIGAGHAIYGRGRHFQIGEQPLDPSPGFGAPFPFRPLSYEPARREPVYWGWGGKLRPDAWDPDPGVKTPDRSGPRRRRD